MRPATSGVADQQRISHGRSGRQFRHGRSHHPSALVCGRAPSREALFRQRANKPIRAAETRWLDAGGDG
eukprot:8984097-Heterocapsa_arctica.AAC.1